MRAPVTGVAAPSVGGCPACGASVRPGAAWCTLCFADLRPVPPPRLVPAGAIRPTPPPPPPGSPPPTAAPLAAVPLNAAALVPCTVCETPMPVVARACPACGSGLLDGLRSTTAASMRLPLIGDLMRFGRGARATIVLALSLLVVLAVLLPFVLFA